MWIYDACNLWLKASRYTIKAMKSTLSVEETIPAGLQLDVEAALDWFNAQKNETQGVTFEVTGIIDAEASLQQQGDRDLRLVLCGGDRCEQRRFRSSQSSEGVSISFAESGDGKAVGSQPNAKLDPPPGALKNWLDRTLDGHKFTFIVFYRGLW